MTTAQEPATILKCRYRYATGCDATYGSKPGLYAHEKQGAAHATHRVELRDCPECGASLTGEAQRGQHLSDEHGIRAQSERRQELDARQVKELFDARAQAASPPPVLMPFPPPGPQASAVPAANGHSPDGTDAAPQAAAVNAPAPVDLPAVQGTFTALIAEVEALRAENAALRAEAATFARIRAMLAGQAGDQP